MTDLARDRDVSRLASVKVLVKAAERELGASVVKLEAEDRISQLALIAKGLHKGRVAGAAKSREGEADERVQLAKERVGR